jgi:hypothetical protein
VLLGGGMVIEIGGEGFIIWFWFGLELDLFLVFWDVDFILVIV